MKRGERFTSCWSTGSLEHRRSNMMLERQVLQGLRYLHHGKIVQKDIKPSNLLINKRQEVKIAGSENCRLEIHRHKHLLKLQCLIQCRQQAIVKEPTKVIKVAVINMLQPCLASLFLFLSFSSWFRFLLCDCCRIHRQQKW